jgi:hypothetical protein
MSEDPENPQAKEAEAMALQDMLMFEWDNIAISIGIPPRWEREWTQEELDRIYAEADRLYGPS